MPRRKRIINKTTYVSKGNVLDDLGFSSEMTAVLKMKSDLFNRVISIIQKRKYTSRELEKLLNQPQPRISELLNGKLSKLSIDRLLEYLECLGAQVSISVKIKRIA